MFGYQVLVFGSGGGAGAVEVDYLVVAGGGGGGANYGGGGGAGGLRTSYGSGSLDSGVPLEFATGESYTVTIGGTTPAHSVGNDSSVVHVDGTFAASGGGKGAQQWGSQAGGNGGSGGGSPTPGEGNAGG